MDQGKDPGKGQGPETDMGAGAWKNPNLNLNWFMRLVPGSDPEMGSQTLQDLVDR